MKIPCETLTEVQTVGYSKHFVFIFYIILGTENSM